MKQEHFFVMFVLIACGCFLSLYCEQKYYDSVMKEKQKIECALLETVEDTGIRCVKALEENEDRKKQIISETFSEAITIFMGYFDTPEEKDFWRLYVPMLVWVEEDGAFFYYLQLKNEKGEKELNHVWTDKIFFSFPEGCSDMKKKALMADVLEQKASGIITNHNVIAAQYGLSYHYFLPVFFQDTSRLPEFPMLFIVFQGWPINHSRMLYYDACLDAGMFLRQKQDSPVPYPKVLNFPRDEMENISTME